MKAYRLFHALATASILMLGSGQTMAEQIRVAVASNFTGAIKRVTERFEADSDHKVILSFGSTGKHYAQIKNGAPFDAFFAADSKRPNLLEKEGIALTGTRFTYAMGKIILWSPKPGYIDSDGKILQKGGFRYLAIANPKLAPYGVAAKQVLQTRGVWQALKAKMVRGENIGQTFQFIKSGNAELGFVAYSQVKRPGQPMVGSWWEVPETLYTPIAQQAILLTEKQAAKDFMSFMKNDASLAIIRGFGYATP